jgi:hypothetical protein
MTDKQPNISKLSKQSAQRMKVEAENLIITSTKTEADAELLKVQTRMARLMRLTKDKSTL